MIFSVAGLMKLPPSRMRNGWRNISVIRRYPIGGRNWFLPNVKAWRPSQDTFTTDSPPQVIHTYLTGWFGILALDHIEDVILNDNSVAFVLDRNGPPYIIKNNIGAIIQDVAVSADICRIALSDGRVQLNENEKYELEADLSAQFAGMVRIAAQIQG